MRDPNISFLKKFVELYQTLTHHDGYGDMTVSIRIGQGGNREVVLLCGKEYRYAIGNPAADRYPRHYKVVSVRGNRHAYSGPERRSGLDRRHGEERRERRSGPRNFRLERRLESDRRSSRGRRRDD